MILKHLRNLLPKPHPSHHPSFQISTSILDTISQIRNPNTKFEAGQCSINLKKRGDNVYTIDGGQYVLAFVIVDNLLGDKAWGARKIFMMRFGEVGELAGLGLRSGKMVDFHALHVNKYSGEQTEKTLTLTDQPSTETIQILYTESQVPKPKKPQKPSPSPSLSPSPSHPLTCTMEYTEYRIMHKLIEKSLLQLSGYKMMLQVQRTQMFQRIQGKEETDRRVGEIFGLGGEDIQ